jgi:hypothetical protein
MKIKLILLLKAILTLSNIDINKYSVNCYPLNTNQNECNFDLYPSKGCPLNSQQFCNNETNVCECDQKSDYPISYRNIDNNYEFCLKKRNIYETCISSEQCFHYKSINNSFTTNQKSFNSSLIFCDYFVDKYFNYSLIFKDINEWKSMFKMDSDFSQSITGRQEFGFCKCRQNYIYNHLSGRCLDVENVKNICNNDSDCQSNDKSLVCAQSLSINDLTNGQKCECIESSIVAKNKLWIKNCSTDEEFGYEEVVTQYIESPDNYWFEKRSSFNNMFAIFSVLFLFAILAEIVLKIISKTYYRHRFDNSLSNIYLNANNGSSVPSNAISIRQPFGERFSDINGFVGLLTINGSTNSLMSDISNDEQPPNYEEAIAGTDRSTRSETQI